jgi:hypothetical protein
MSKQPEPPKPQQETQPPPTMCRVVQYRLGAADVQQIARQRSAAQYVSHGNEVNVGDVFPMIVIRAWKPGDAEHTINGQALLDGNDSLWVTTAKQGDGPGQWQWPARS